MGAVLVLGGCVAGAIRLAVAPPAFDHGAHGKRELDCADCHEEAARSERAGMPAPDLCASCHDPKEDKPAVAREVADYGTNAAAGGFPSAAVRGPTYADVKFGHAGHVKAGTDCRACHAATIDRRPAAPLTMGECEACHEAKGAPTTCETCHTRLGKGSPPSNHGPGWRTRHGAIALAADRSAPAERCDACHARADCDACHAVNPPRDHGNAFRTATHGLEAAIDRSRCVACHTADSCDRCHEVEPPRSHGPSFGAPTDGHCVRCHLPIGATGCVTCHKGTPSHELAPPKPPSIPAHLSRATTPAQCLACHRRISHPATLEDCNACHR